MKEKHSIEYKESKLFFQKSGSGQKSLLLFHGFGQDRNVFNQWNENDFLNTTYTCYSFDIFSHGESVWSDKEPVLKENWKEILMIFLVKNKIEQFSVLGFSMGGKFALATLETFPTYIDEIFLLAPDGIKTNFWYSLATYPIGLRSLFKSMINKPQRFYTIARAAQKFGLIDKGILRFVESQMDTKEKRERVYFSWIAFRPFKFNMNEIARIINQNHIHTTIIVGRFDKIITIKNMDVLMNKIVNGNLKILETGHNGIIAASIDLIVPSSKA